MRHFFPRSRKTFRLILWSYLCVVVVTLLFNVAMALSSSQTLSKEIRSANENALQQFQALMDAQLREVEVLAYQITTDSEIRRLAIQQWMGKSSDHYYTQAQVCKNMLRSIPQESLVEDMYVWFLKDDYLLTNRGSYTQREYYARLVSLGIDLEAQSWKKANENVNTSRYQRLPAQQGSRIVFQQNVLTNAGFAKDAVVGVLLNHQLLTRSLNNATTLTGTGIFVLDENNDCLLSSGEEITQAAKHYANLSFNEKRLQTQGHSKINLGGQGYYVSEQPSHVNKWRYVMITSSGALMASQREMIGASVLFILGALVAATVLCLVVATWQYAPVKRMVHTLGGEQDGDDFAFIEKAVEEVLQAKDSLEDSLEDSLMRQTNLLKESALIQLLHEPGKNPGEIALLLRECGILLPHGGFHVVCFSIFPKGEGFAITQVERILRDVLGPFFQRQAFAYYFFRLRGRMILLVNGPPNKQITQELVKELKRVCAVIEQHRQGALLASVSREIQAIENLGEAYHQALEVEAYLLFLKRDGVAVYEEALGGGEPLSTYIALEEKKIVNQLLAGQYNEGAQALKALADRTLRGDNAAPVLEYRVYKLYTSLQRINLRLFPLNSGPESQLAGELSQWLGCKDQEGLLICLEQYTQRVLGQLATTTPKEEDGSVATKAEKLIYAQYMSPDLTVQTLVEQVKVSQATLTRVFKRHFGCGVLEYIHRIRIEKAKELMEKEAFGIQQIAEQTGFINSVSFIRVFKKNEGITPGAFRKIQRNQMEE